MNAAKPVIDQQVDDVLVKVEQGETNQDDANLLRNYLRGIRSILKAFQLQSDDESIGDDE